MSALPLFQVATRLNTQNAYETEIQRNKFLYEYRYFQSAYLKYQTHENEFIT